MVVKLFHRHSMIVCIFVLIVVIAITMAVNFNRSPPAQTASVKLNSATSAVGVSSTIRVTEVDDEMRAVWVPYLSLNMSREDDRSEQGFLKKFNTIVNNAKKCGMNTLIVQVRPFADALYPSSYFPWSHVVGGTQGVNPGYDPLADMVKICHQEGLKIHAWINPLRIQISNTPSILAVGNIYNTWKNAPEKADWVVDFQNGKYFNPAYAEVRKLIADGAKEIAEKYDVDGIQFDDYFYPTQDSSFDQTAYDAYCKTAEQTGTPMSLSDWRRANISAMVSLVYQEIKSVRPSLQFGIAPQGNIQNDLAMGANVTEWCSVSGYVDYICPQLYVNFENPVLPFDTAAKTWREMVTNQNVKLYFGLAVYKAGSETDSGTWKNSSNILATQVKFGREISCDGFMFYSADYLDTDQTKQEVQNVMKVLKNVS
ncbi:MAG: GHL10 domain-containing protein [Oscillospiraceae bacterium]|jgi:uncharacterized lipoprotein YddW (UPF0748 family)